MSPEAFTDQQLVGQLDASQIIQVVSEQTDPNTAAPSKRNRGQNWADLTRGGDEEQILTLYLSEAGRQPLLNKEEEIELAKKVQAGLEIRYKAQQKRQKDFTTEERRTIRDGLAAKDRFIKSNLRLVVSIAKRYPTTASQSLLDLIQDGNLGLEHAVDKFDWRRGFKFSTYATYWIKQAITKGLDDHGGAIRLPSDKGSALRAAIRDPENPHLKHALHLVRFTNLASLDIKINEDPDSPTAADSLPSVASEFDPDLRVERVSDREIIRKLLTGVDEKQRAMVEARFGLITGDSMTYAEVGKNFGYTAESARVQILRALGKITEFAKQENIVAD